jgi:hypothetical protein
MNGLRPALLVLILFFLSPLRPAAAQASDPPVPRSEYLEYARASANWTWDHYDEILQRWRQDFDPDSVFGYRPPPRLLEMAVIYAYLFEHEHDRSCADRAKTVLLTYGDFREIYPDAAAARRPDYADGVPALPDFFTAMRYIRAYDTLHQLDQFSNDEITYIESLIAHSMEYLLRTAEWGPMNRAALRAETLAWAVRALPDHPRAKVWDMQRKALADDNWGAWEIEDATIYHGVWLYALLGCADARDEMSALFRTPEMYYYAQYFLNLMCPAGMIPDFGDAHWLSNWPHYLVFFETAAAYYDDPRMKWAATIIARTFIDFDEPTNVGLGHFLLDCARWGTDDLTPAAPTSTSREVMEDVQGKKIVFRNGWDPDSTYLLLNYRDEGDGGLLFRDYLRDTIPVEEEKMTHGHADENSIILLMSGGSVLLHDGGYRDYMPSGPYGAYRQDYFHNRLCVRPEKIWMGQEQGGHRYSIRDVVPSQPILDFLHNAGSYRPVRTRKIDFLTFPDFAYSRTRLIDDQMAYQWDRVIAYVKEPELFVVFDVFKSHTEGYFTIANLWHTRLILDRGDHWYDTVYDRIGQRTLPQDRRLLIMFPDTHYGLEGVEDERRHEQDEVLIHQTTARHFELADTETLVTILIPHDADLTPRSWVGRVHLVRGEPGRAGLAVRIDLPDRHLLIGAKADLRMDIARDWRRPRYTYESGRIRFDALESNGDFVFIDRRPERLNYTIVNLTRALYGRQILYEAQPSYFGLAFDASPDTTGVGKVRYWRATADITNNE